MQKSHDFKFDTSEIAHLCFQPYLSQRNYIADGEPALVKTKIGITGTNEQRLNGEHATKGGRLTKRLTIINDKRSVLYSITVL